MTKYAGAGILEEAMDEDLQLSREELALLDAYSPELQQIGPEIQRGRGRGRGQKRGQGKSRGGGRQPSRGKRYELISIALEELLVG